MSDEKDPSLSDRYSLVRHLGFGATATVYVAVDQRTGEQVAVKVMHQQFARSQALRRRFLREAKAAKRLTTPHAIRVFEVGELQDRRPVMVMELLAGATLGQVLREARGPLDAERALFLADQIASALQDAHANNVVHRDLKPDNVFILGSGENEWVKVVDFGISKLLGETEGTQLTGTGMLLGTPVYMALEQLEGRTDVDHRADVYALGVVLFEMLAGASPHEEAVNYVSLLSLVQSPAPLLSLHRSDLPPGLVDVVARAMASERDARIQSMELLRQLLAPYWSGRTPQPPHDNAGHHGVEQLQYEELPDDGERQLEEAPTLEVKKPPREWTGLLSALGPPPTRAPRPRTKPPKPSR